MPETLTPSSYNDEIDQPIDHNLTVGDNEKEKWWDVMAVGMQEAGRTPAHRAETPAVMYEDTSRHSEPLLEPGEPEPLLEALNPTHIEGEPSPLEIANLDEPTNELFADDDELSAEEQAVLENALPAPESDVPMLAHSNEITSFEPFAVEETVAPVEREPRVPKHAAEFHEANENFDPEDRFNNLLLVANHIIDRRKAAVAGTSVDTIDAAGDISAFVELYGQYKAEFKANDVDDSSLELISKLVTGAYDLIDNGPAYAEIASSEIVIDEPKPPTRLETMSPEEVQDETLSRHYVGDSVSFLVDDDNLESGWLITQDQFVYPEGFQGITNDREGGVHEYTIEKDGRRLQGVRAEQLGFERETAPTTMENPFVVAEAPLDAPETTTGASAEVMSEEELDGVDDLTEVEDAPPTGATEVITPQIESEVSMIPEKSRLDKIRDFKKVFGIKYWAAKWEKMEHPERRRSLILLGTSALVVASIIAGQNNANRANERGLGDAESSPFPSTSETYTPAPPIPDVKVEPLPQPGQAQEAQSSTENKGVTEYPKDTFTVKLDDGPLKTVNRLGYTDDKWYAIGESMNADFPEYFYKAGNDIRYNHVGELPKRVQDAFINRLKGA